MKTVFENLKKISSNYRSTVDNLAQDHDLDSRKDFLYNDEIRLQRVAERNTRFNRLIDEAAEKALAEATEELDKLRGAVREYVTSSDDATTLAAVQALVSAGVELSDSELAAFSQKGGFATWKLLEKHTGGKIKGPQMTTLDADLRELQNYFMDIGCYRGELASISTSTPWGLASVTGNAIQQGRLEGFQKKLDEMAARWAVLKR